MGVSPQNWPTLVHTCRKWRRIVFASQRALHLRLICTHGTPVRKILACWPATLPIVVEYGGTPRLDAPAPEDEDNVMATLKQSNRVISISLTVTTALQARLSTIVSPFSELEDLVLLSRDSVRTLIQPITSRSGRWGTRLRSLHLTKIAFLELSQLLYSSRNLVDLQLHEVLYPTDFSTEALMMALSGMTQLRSLSLHFLPPTFQFTVFLPPRKRFTLPSLTRFDFRGITKFLQAFVAGIYAPRLGDIKVTFLDESMSDLSVLIEFINRIKMHKSPRRADILSSEHDITISLIQPGGPTRLELKFLFKSLLEQLSSMNRICIQFSAFLVNVEDLRIDAERPSTLDDILYHEQWLNTINCKSFIGVRWLQVSGNLLRNILRSLQIRDRQDGFLLPVMHKIYVLQPLPRHASLGEAVMSLMTSHGQSGRPIAVDYEHIFHFREPHGAGEVIVINARATNC